MKTDEFEELIETIGEVTIQGRVIPTEWDKDRKVTGIGIESGGDEYIVFLNSAGEKLFRHMNREVEATGSVKKMFGEFIFTIETYKLLNQHDRQGLL
jgi:hypothetical protein